MIVGVCYVRWSVRKSIQKVQEVEFELKAITELSLPIPSDFLHLRGLTNPVMHSRVTPNCGKSYLATVRSTHNHMHYIFGSCIIFYSVPNVIVQVTMP